MWFFYGVHRFAPIHMLEGDIGWTSTICNRHVNMCKYYNRLLKMDRDRLTRKIFDYDISKCRNNWSHELKQIFSKVGMVELLHNNLECDIDCLNVK